MTTALTPGTPVSWQTWTAPRGDIQRGTVEAINADGSVAISYGPWDDRMTVPRERVGELRVET